MLQAFIVVFREGFESFLIVGIILAYLRRIGRHQLIPAMYWGIGASLIASAGLGYMLSKGVNESLWEGIFGVATIVLVGSLVIHMWKAGAHMKRDMEGRLSRISAQSSKGWALAGVFLFTLVMITKEGMETFLLLFMVQIGIYSFHEFSEAGVLPNSAVLHEATEPLSPTGIYGSWFSIIAISVCAIWLIAAYVSDSLKRKSPPRIDQNPHATNRIAFR